MVTFHIIEDLKAKVIWFLWLLVAVAIVIALLVFGITVLYVRFEKLRQRLESLFPFTSLLCKISSERRMNSPYQNRTDIGNATRAVTSMSEWYSVTTYPFPSTVPLSLRRNRGFTKGGNIKLLSDGLCINEPGDYTLTFQITVLNTNPNAIIIPIFLVRNDNPIQNSDGVVSAELGNTALVLAGALDTINSTGPVVNICKGTKLSLVISNGASVQPEPIIVIAWSISAVRIGESVICNPNSDCKCTQVCGICKCNKDHIHPDKASITWCSVEEMKTRLIV